MWEWGVLELMWGMRCPRAGVGNGVSWSWCGEWGVVSWRWCGEWSVLELVWGMRCPRAGVGNEVS